MDLLRTMWSAAVFWPAWLCAGTVAFLLREIWALASGRPGDTLSWWVWRNLGIVVGQRPQDWTAGAFLVFGVWAVLVIWLTGHFFFREWA